MSIKRAIKKIGIFSALYSGDILCVIPAVRAIKKAYPEAALTLIGLLSQKKIAERFRHYFNGFLEFPGLPEQEMTPSHISHFLQQAHEYKFDLVIQMQGEVTSTNSMCTLLGASHVAGLRLPGHYCTDESLFPVFDEKEHEILRFLRIVKALGIPLQGTALEFPVTDQENRNFEKLKSILGIQKGNYICLHPGAQDPGRRWPAENFARVADMLAAKGHIIVITGLKEERDITRKITELMDHHAIDLVNQAGNVGIGELGILIGHAAALLSNDTGVSHIAAALETPSVVVFSSYSDPPRWAPLNSDLHTPVTAEQAKNPAYVFNAMLNHLEEEHATRYRHVYLNKTGYQAWAK